MGKAPTISTWTKCFNLGGLKTASPVEYVCALAHVEKRAVKPARIDVLQLNMMTSVGM